MGPEATQMFGADWERIGALFQRATLLPPEQRYRFIYEETADEPQVRAELLALLAYDRTRGNGPLSRAVGGALVDVIQDNRRAFLGRVVGSYKLIAILGEGGTGTVYLGERADHQYSAQVAVKIIDYAAVQGSFGERFRAERQILHHMRHPHRCFSAYCSGSSNGRSEYV